MNNKYPYSLYKNVFDKALKLDLVADEDILSSSAWRHMIADEQDFQITQLEEEIYHTERRQEEEQEREEEIAVLTEKGVLPCPVCGELPYCFQRLGTYGEHMHWYYECEHEKIKWDELHRRTYREAFTFRSINFKDEADGIKDWNAKVKDLQQMRQSNDK